MDIGGTLVDACKSHCGGVWFDWFELKKVDEPFEAAGEVLLDIERDDELGIDHSKRRTCPRCKGNMIMMRHFSSVKKEAEVDECPKCAGFWLDAGELDSIRSAFSSEEEKIREAEKFVNGYIETHYGDDLKKMKARSKAQLNFAKKFAQAFSFLCPSKYIPGKQEGGAF
jgi:Zn-finger nucleic acid-binding protein